VACEWTQCGQGSGRAGIRAPLLYRWARPRRQANLSGNESKSGRSVEELEAEIRRLRAENAKLLEQREVLKKSLGHPLRSAAERYARIQQISADRVCSKSGRPNRCGLFRLRRKSCRPRLTHTAKRETTTAEVLTESNRTVTNPYLPVRWPPVIGP
jgi:hypothetical protein